MPPDPLIMLYGDSLFLAGIEVSLRAMHGFTVVRVSGNLAEAEASYDALRPNVIIIDTSADHADDTVRSLSALPGLRLVGLTPASCDVVVFSGARSPATTMDDLARILQTECAA
jgi:DNA-binding NarL/FixJ family response regulator